MKGWNVPTGETITDHIVTFFATVFNAEGGTTLPCGHIILPGTFPLERYNGCPFCGTPFQLSKIEDFKQGSVTRMLEVWTETDAENYLKDLLLSVTPLDATQDDSLKVLLVNFDLPDVPIAMKETVIVAAAAMMDKGKADLIKHYFKTPVDIMRLLWYRHTGFRQLVEPKTIIRRDKFNNAHILQQRNHSASVPY